MLSIQNVTKTFGGCRALDGLTMTVPRGAVYGLVGPNGAGKSTLIRCAAGVYRPDAGTITLDGAPVYENPAAKARIGYIPDDVFHFPSASIRDMASFYRGVYRSFDDARFAKLREAFALDEKQPIRRMSKGMQKQAAFWLTLSMRPELLILDEPVDGLDPVMRRQVWGIVMGDAAEYGTTVLVASHNLRELEDVCDHVGVLDHGRLLLERSLAALQSGTVKALVALPEGAELPQDLGCIILMQDRIIVFPDINMILADGKQHRDISLRDHMPLAKYGILCHTFYDLRDVMAENLSDGIHSFHFLHTAYSPITCSIHEKRLSSIDGKIVFTC